MKLREVVKTLGLEVVNEADLELEVEGGYASDLLSNVMARAGKGQLWITQQGHQNIIAVAVLVELAGVIVVDGIKVEPETLRKAREEGVNLFTTPLSGFTASGLLYQLGVCGKEDV